MTSERSTNVASIALTATICALMLTHTYLRLLGPVSALQVLIIGVYGAFVFPRYLGRLAASGLIVLLFSALQYALFNDRLPSTVFQSRVYTYPALFCFLLGFLTVIADLLHRRRLSHATISVAALAILAVCAALAAASLYLARPDLLSWFYDNPNELSVAVTAALFYLAFCGSRPAIVYPAAACSIFVTFVGGSRYSILYALVIVLAYTFLVIPKGHDQKSRIIRYCSYLAAAVAAIAVAATFAANSVFHVGGFEEFGVVPEALLLGWNAVTPPTTSVGYRFNNVLAGLATLVQTFGVGIGLGRSAGLTETISGLAGSIHVPPIELLIELGPCALAILAWVNLRGVPYRVLRTCGFWFVLGALGMAVQSSAYLTSYLAWFFTLALCQVKAELPPTADVDADERKQMKLASSTTSGSNFVNVLSLQG